MKLIHAAVLLTAITASLGSQSNPPLPAAPNLDLPTLVVEVPRLTEDAVSVFFAGDLALPEPRLTWDLPAPQMPELPRLLLEGRGRVPELARPLGSQGVIFSEGIIQAGWPGYLGGSLALFRAGVEPRFGLRFDHESRDSYWTGLQTTLPGEAYHFRRTALQAEMFQTGELSELGLKLHLLDHAYGLEMPGTAWLYRELGGHFTVTAPLNSGFSWETNAAAFSGTPTLSLEAASSWQRQNLRLATGLSWIQGPWEIRGSARGSFGRVISPSEGEASELKAGAELQTLFQTGAWRISLESQPGWSLASGWTWPASLSLGFEDTWGFVRLQGAWVQEDASLDTWWTDQDRRPVDLGEMVNEKPSTQRTDLKGALEWSAPGNWVLGLDSFARGGFQLSELPRESGSSLRSYGPTSGWQFQISPRFGYRSPEWQTFVRYTYDFEEPDTIRNGLELSAQAKAGELTGEMQVSTDFSSWPRAGFTFSWSPDSAVTWSLAARDVLGYAVPGGRREELSDFLLPGPLVLLSVKLSL